MRDAARLQSLDLCEGLVTDLEPRRVKPVQRPPYSKRYRDPAFGTTIVRITNSSINEVYKPAYSTMQAWNADESLLLLWRQTNDTSGHILLDGFTYEPIRVLDAVPSDLEEIFWSHTDPDSLFYLSSSPEDYGDFNKLNVNTGEKTFIKNFSNVCGDGVLPTSGADVHMQPLNDDVFGFRCETGENWTMFTHSVSKQKTTVAQLGAGTPWVNESAPQGLPSGNGFWMQGSALEDDLTTIRTKLDVFAFHEHGDTGVGGWSLNGARLNHRRMPPGD